MKNIQKSNLETALAHGGGGLSAQKAQLPPLQSLARAEIPEPSSALAQEERLHNSIHPGNPQLSNGGENVLTEEKGSTIPNLTLAATANWVLTILNKRGLIRFVLNNESGNYEAHFPVSTWKLTENNVLTLAEKDTE